MTMRGSPIPLLPVSLLPVSLLPVFLAGCGAAAEGNIRPAEARTPVASFASDGSLQRPHGYRAWVYVGAPLTPNDMNNGKAPFPEFHNVYVDPESFEAWKRTGKWRDGTVFAKELVSVGSKSATSGNGYFMGEFIGLEISIKSAARFPNEPGNWGYFRFTDEEGGPVRRAATVLPTSACAGCHSSAAADDLVFTQYYPVLRAAKQAGQRVPEDA